MSKRIDQIGTVTPASGDKYVIYDASAGDVGAVDVILPMTAATSGTGGTGGTVPAPAAGKQKALLQGDATWVDPVCYSMTSVQKVMEFGVVEGSSGNWNVPVLTLGGMDFKWSQAAISGGYLTYTKNTGTALAQVGGHQSVRKFVDSTVTGSDSGTDNIWPSTGTVNVRTSITMGGAYQMMEYNITTRSSASSLAHWCIKCFHTGSNSLVISGTYIGPKP